MTSSAPSRFAFVFVTLPRLTERHYLRALPIDSVTNRTDSWIPVEGVDEEEKTIVDVKSGAQGKALDGTEYSSW